MATVSGAGAKLLVRDLAPSLLGEAISALL
jgi:hypothetical protein